MDGPSEDMACFRKNFERMQTFKSSTSKMWLASWMIPEVLLTVLKSWLHGEYPEFL
jgi:hypothetical protein